MVPRLQAMGRQKKEVIMTQRLIKIVYGYDIEKDGIAARHSYDDGSSEPILHTRQEWEDLLYDIRKNQPEVVIRTAERELME